MIYCIASPERTPILLASRGVESSSQYCHIPIYAGRLVPLGNILAVVRNKKNYLEMVRLQFGQIPWLERVISRSVIPCPVRCDFTNPMAASRVGSRSIGIT
nr:hypothetical protein ILHNEKOK_00024 [Klebsiella pneumoniae]WLE92322.1 hypothetical protein ILHNEKOK_00258 [Klebsiella pneumoniae]